MKGRTINRHKVVGYHPVTNEAVNLKWFRGAGRYNNGATRFGRKYEFRHIISSLKA